jgi:hypothetical protein
MYIQEDVNKHYQLIYQGNAHKLQLYEIFTNIWRGVLDATLCDIFCQ